MNKTNNSREGNLMKRTAAALAGLAVFALSTPAFAGTHASRTGWTHSTRNPHNVTVQTVNWRGGPTCLQWAVLNKVGDKPVCIVWG